MALASTQIIALHWFYNSHEKGQPASYKGSLEHFGEVLKISDPMNVLMSLLDMKLISINKNKFEVSITKSGIQLIEGLKKGK